MNKTRMLSSLLAAGIIFLLPGITFALPSANGLVLPHSVNISQLTSPCTYQITNKGVESITKVDIVIPTPYFTYASLGVVNASNGKQWNAVCFGGIVTLTPFSPSDYLANGEYVKVVIYTATYASEESPVPWNATVTSTVGTSAVTESVTNDIKIAITGLGSQGLVTPHNVDDNQSNVSFVYRVTNKNTDTVKNIDIVIPSAFTYISSSNLTVSGSKSWNVSASGNTISLNAPLPANYISNNEFVQLTINAATSTGSNPNKVWISTITGSLNGVLRSAEATSGDMNVSVNTLNAYGLVTAHKVYAGQSSVAITYKITNNGQDSITKADITIPAGFTFQGFGAITCSNGSKTWSSTRSGGIITLNASGAGHYISNSEYVEAVINVTTQPTAKNATTWPCTITGSYSGTKAVTEQTLGDMQVEILTFCANAVTDPHYVYSSTLSTIKYTITNTGTESLKKIEISMPAGFTYVSISPVTASGKNWLSSYSGGKITLTPDTSNDYIQIGQAVQIDITVNTQGTAQNAIIWPANITGTIDGITPCTEAVSGDMKVEILTLTAYGSVNPHFIGANQTSIDITYTITNIGTDKIKLAEITIPSGFTYSSVQSLTVSGSKNWTSAFGSSKITLTPSDDTDYLSQNEIIQAVIRINTGAARSATTWTSTITGEKNKTTAVTSNVSGDLNIEICDLLAYGTITPHIVNGGQTATFTYRFTNKDGNSIKSATISVPSGFTFGSVSAVTASNSKAWTSSYSAPILTLNASNPSSNYISNTEYVQVVFTAISQNASQTAIKWDGSTTGSGNDIRNIVDVSTGDLKVEIKSLSGTATVSPNVVSGSQSSIPITYKVDNTGDDSIRRVQIVIPAGFTYVSLGTVSASGSKSWYASRSGNVITLTATALSDYITNTESVQGIINIQTQSASQSPVVWVSTITGSYNGFSGTTDTAPGSRSMEIKLLDALGLVTPRTVDGGQTFQPVTYNITNKGDDKLTRARITLPSGFTEVSLGALNASGSKNWTSTYDSATKIVTLQAQNSGAYLLRDEHIEIIINVATQAGNQILTTWPAECDFEAGGTKAVIEQTGNDMKVEIKSLFATGLALPRIVDGSQTAQPLTYRINNTGSDDIALCYIYIPAGFTFVSTTTITASSGKIWRASYDSFNHIISLSPDVPTSNISNGEYIQVGFKVQTQSNSQSPVLWNATVTGFNNGTASCSESTVNDTRMEIKSLSGNGLATPHIVGSGTNANITYRVTSTGLDTLKKAEIIIPSSFTYVSHVTPVASAGKNWTASYSPGKMTLTPNTEADQISNSQYVEIVMTVSTYNGDTPPLHWPCTITGNYDGTVAITELVTNDMKVDINTVVVNGLVTPHRVDGGQSGQAITYRFTNTGTDRLKGTSIFIPSGFTYSSMGAVTTSISTKTWTAQFSGGMVVVSASNQSSYIADGEWVQVVMYAATQEAAQPAITWFAQATGESTHSTAVIEAVAGDMKVEIVPLSGTGVITPHLVESGQASIPLTYKITNTGVDSVRSVRINIPNGFTYVSISSVTATGYKGWSTSYSGNLITLNSNNTSQNITTGEYASVSINVATADALIAPTTWYCNVIGSLNGTKEVTEVTKGDKIVQIYYLAAHALAAPPQVYNGQNSVSIVYKITNAGQDVIKEFTIAVPSGFTYVSHNSLASSRHWTASVNGSTITLSPVDSGDYIANNEYVQLRILVNTQGSAQPPINWTSTIKGGLGGSIPTHDNTTGDRAVEIVDLAAYGLITPHSVLSDQSNISLVYRITSYGTEDIKRLKISIPSGFTYVSSLAPTASVGKNWLPNILGSNVELYADTPNDYLKANNYVQIVIFVRTQSELLAPTTWPCLLTGKNNGTEDAVEQNPNDMKVQIVELAAASEIRPHKVDISQQNFKMFYRVTNINIAQIQRSTFTIPSGFNFVSFGTTTVSNNKLWSRSINGRIVTLNANSAANYLVKNEYIEQAFFVNIQTYTATNTNWPSSVVDKNGVETECIEWVLDDTKASIFTLGAYALVSPHKIHTSALSRPVSYKITNNGEDPLQEASITLPSGFTYAGMGTISASSTKVWNSTAAGSVVTIKAVNSDDYLLTNEWVEATILVNTQSSKIPPQTWLSTVKGSYEGIMPSTAAAEGDMDAEIAILASTAAITPHQVYNNTPTQLLTYSIGCTNTDDIKYAAITIPSGFTFVDVDTVTAPGSKNWRYIYSNGKIIVTAVTPYDAISYNEVVDVKFYVASSPNIQLPVIWPVSVTGVSDVSANATEAYTNSMKVEIVKFGVNAIVTPHQVYVNQPNQIITYRITNSGTERLKVAYITIPHGFTYNFNSPVTASNGKTWFSTMVGDLLSIAAQNSDSYIDTSEYVEVVMNVATSSSTQNSTYWPAQLLGENSGSFAATELNLGDMRIEIVDLTSFAQIQPHKLDTGQISQDVTVTITNRNIEKFNQVRIRIPTGFTYNSALSPVVTDNKIWNVTFSTPLVTLNANSPLDYLSDNESISVVIKVATRNTPLASSNWSTTVVGILGGISSAQQLQEGDLDVELIQMKTTAKITPHFLYNGTVNQLLTYEVIPVTGTTGLKKIEIPVPSGFTYKNVENIIASGSKRWNSSYELGVITCQAERPSDVIDFGETVTAGIRVDAQTNGQLPITWPSLTTNNNNAVIASTYVASGDMQVEIVGFKIYGSMSPHKITAGQINVPVFITLTNKDTEKMKHAQITIPPGFTFIGLSGVTASNFKNWTSSQSASVITLNAISAFDYIETNENIQIAVYVNTQNLPQEPVKWTAVAQGLLGGTKEVLEQTSGDLYTEIIMFGATMSIQPSSMFVNQTNQEITFKIKNTREDKIVRIDLLIPEQFAYESYMSMSASNNKQWNRVLSSNILTLTAQSSADYLLKDEILEIKFKAASGSTPAKGIEWSALITGESNASVVALEDYKNSTKMDLIGYTITVTAYPQILMPGGTSTLSATLAYNNGDVIGGQRINFQIISGNARFIGTNTDITNIDGVTSAILTTNVKGNIEIEAWFNNHTSTGMILYVVDNIPVLKKPLFAFYENDILHIKQNKSLLDFETIPGLNIEYKFDTGAWTRFESPCVIDIQGMKTLYFRFIDDSGMAGQTGQQKLYASSQLEQDRNKVINYPNPFHAGKEPTFIEYYLDNDANVTIEIFDLFGQLVWQQKIQAGQEGAKTDLNQILWYGVNEAGTVISSGGYILRVNAAGKNVLHRKIAVVK